MDEGMEVDVGHPDSGVVRVSSWITAHYLVGTILERIISELDSKTPTAATLEALELLRISLRTAPIKLESQTPKSLRDMKTLWVNLDGVEHRQAKFLMGMWASSMHTGEPSEDVHAQLLNEAFSADFKGDALELFCRAMGGYADAYNHDEYYGRIIAWYGPSGAGKSKALDALKDKFPTFTICFRSSDNPSEGWPPGDAPAYEFFNATAGKLTAEARVAIFLGALLKVAAEGLEDGVAPTSNARNHWDYRFRIGVPYERSTRGQLFARVGKEAMTLMNSHMELDGEGEAGQQYRQLWERFCEQPALALVEKLSTPYCFVALDECTEIPSVRPISLRRILSAGRNISQLWFILLGTNAKINQLVPTSTTVKPSDRFHKLKCLPVWCHFGFGQLSPSDPTTPKDALEVEYLRKIGRPLFATCKIPYAAYEIARAKLFHPERTFDANNTRHVLTAFSHRILLQLGNTPTALQIAADSVNSSLRYVTRMDGGIVQTVCPSEPLLSLIAADVLNQDSNFARSLQTLVDAVKTATVDRGQEGELYCRLLIIHSRDAACQRNLHLDVAIPRHAEDTFSQASYCVRLITLEAHLDNLVHLNNIDDAQTTGLRAFARPYHVNITHIIQFRDIITAIPQTYLYHLFIRGAAVQCCSSQPVIDGFYVAYRGELDKPFDLGKFAIISWQSKARTAAASKVELIASLTGPMQIDLAGKRCKPEQLVILMDLNVKAAFRGGDANLQVARRTAKVPVYAETKNGIQTTPWGGYAVSPEEEPETWCLNIRGHGNRSYPCTMAMEIENGVQAPNFSALFAEVRPDIVANSITYEGFRSGDLNLHPLSTF